MRRLIADISGWQRQGDEIALATLVAVHGSSPRFPGARMAVTRSGKLSGSVSGGCVESDVFQQAMEVLDRGRPLLATYGISGEMALDLGLSCGGKIDVLIAPFAAGPAWETVVASVGQRRALAWGVALAPDDLIGRSLTVSGDGNVSGSIDEGVDAAVAAEGRRMLAERGGTGVLELPWGTAQARIFIEALAPPSRLFIVGATHIGIALARMAKEVGFQIVVIDPRATFATPERFPDVEELRCAWPGEVLDAAALDAYSYVVTLSHDPKFDIPTLERALRAEARYIGALGSRRTHARRVRELERLGFAQEQLSRIHAPIGLDLGGRTPEEIAVAILAEMLAVRYGREPRALAGKESAIHAAG